MQLLDLVDADDPFGFPDEEILPLQIAAAQESFARLRTVIPLLDSRAEGAGIQEITSLDDIVPLLFSHTVYKSYPQSFVTKGRWDRLLAWYDSLAAQSVSDVVDLDGVENIDDFAEALTRAGASPYVTSGTSGKVSLLNNTVGDRERSHRIGAAILGWPRPLRTYRSMRFYALGPSRGYSKHIEFSHNLHDLASDIADHRREPMVVMGVWTQHWAIMERAHELGFGDGEFHPDSCVYLLGGLKGVSLPPDYREQIYRFYGDVHRFMTYGMTEIDPTAPICEAGRYHRPPWLMWLVLDQAGERLAEPGADGMLDGRFAVLSFNNEGRWAGLISGDHVHMDTGRCACGRPGPTILDDVVRYSEQEGGDDKIGCAGPRFQFIEGELGDIDRYCELLAEQLGIDRRYGAAAGPRPPLEMREEIEVLGTLSGHRVWGGFGGEGVVIRSEEPVDFHPSHKVVNVVPVASLDDAISFANVATQTVGVFPSERKAALRDGLVASGVQRVLALGRAGTSTRGLPHDGFIPLHRLVRWVADED